MLPANRHLCSLLCIAPAETEDEPGGGEVLENKPAPVPDDEAASAAPDSGPLEGLKDFLMR